jgi:hypothetical protein
LPPESMGLDLDSRFDLLDVLEQIDLAPGLAV